MFKFSSAPSALKTISGRSSRFRVPTVDRLAASARIRMTDSPFDDLLDEDVSGLQAHGSAVPAASTGWASSRAVSPCAMAPQRGLQRERRSDKGRAAYF